MRCNLLIGIDRLFCCQKGVFHQHGYGHRPYSARYRCDPARFLPDRIKIAVSYKFVPSFTGLICHTVDTHIDDDCPSLTISALIRLGWPAATIRISAEIVCVVRSLVNLWQIVVVALPVLFSRDNITAMGEPTILLAPTTTACLLFTGML